MMNKLRKSSTRQRREIIQMNFNLLCDAFSTVDEVLATQRQTVQKLTANAKRFGYLIGEKIYIRDSREVEFSFCTG